MSLLWKPNGTLDIATEPSDLAETKGTALTGEQGSIVSTALARCKNLRLDRKGVISTRFGSSKINSTALAQTDITRIIEQSGVRYTFAGSVIYKDETSIGTGYDPDPWTGILYNAFNSTTQAVFAMNGTQRKKIEGGTIYEWGIDAPTVVPTVAIGGTTGLTGAYKAMYTYCRKSGLTVICESNPSDESTAAATLANQSLSVSWTASADPQVTHVRVYRTLAGGSVFYHDQDVAIGTTSLDTSTADSALGSEVDDTHDRPPLGSYVFGPSYNGTCFIIYNNWLYYCSPKEPECWPATYYVEVSPPQFPCQCGVFYGGHPYVLTKQDIYLIEGTGHLTFFPFPMKAITGCVNGECAVSVYGFGIFHVGSDGIYLFNGSTDKKMTKTEFDPIFYGESKGGVPAIGNMKTAWLKEFHNKLYFGYASGLYSYPTNVLVLDLANERTTYYSYSQEIRTVTVDEQNGRLLAGDTDGYVWTIEHPLKTTDDSTAISWEAESKAFMLQTRAHFPRWVKYDVNSSSATEANGYLLLEGEVHQTHALSDNRSTKKRLVTTGNGKRCSMRVSGTGPVEIYAIEAE